MRQCSMYLLQTEQSCLDRSGMTEKKTVTHSSLRGDIQGERQWRSPGTGALSHLCPELRREDEQNIGGSCAGSAVNQQSSSDRNETWDICVPDALHLQGFCFAPPSFLHAAHLVREFNRTPWDREHACTSMSKWPGVVFLARKGGSNTC